MAVEGRTYDFVKRRTADGRPLRVLNVMDEYTHVALGSLAARSIGAREGTVALAECSRRDTDAMTDSGSTLSSAPAGYRFPREVIAVAVRWYLRYGLSYRDVEELLAERGIMVDHVTAYRWVQTFTSEFIDAARSGRHAAGDRWFVDETYVKVAGRWVYLYRAVDQHGQVIDVLVSHRRDGRAARAFFAGALTHGPAPVEVTTDRAPVYPRVIEDVASSARHVLEQYANNPIEADHGRLKARLRPMRGVKTIRSLRVIAAGRAFVQNLRRGHYEQRRPRRPSSSPRRLHRTRRLPVGSAKRTRPSHRPHADRSTQQCPP